MASNDLTDKLVVVTGASSGIGRATALAFAGRGAYVVLAARDGEALADVVDACRRLGGGAEAVVTDVTDPDAVRRLGETAQRIGGGRLDIWVNNAGVGAVGRFEETPLAAHEQVVQTDLLGYMRGAHVVLPIFKRQGHGVLINTLSLGSWVAQPYAAAYSAAKYGLRGFTEALRGELSGWRGIHVCDVYPAFIDTPGLRDGGNYSGRRIKPPPPVYDPRKVAGAIVSLALRPRASVTVGSIATLLRVQHFLTPGFPALSRWVLDRAFARAKPVAQSSGNLFEPPSGERRIDGGFARGSNTAGALAVGALAVALLGLYAARRLSDRPRSISPWRR